MTIDRYTLRMLSAYKPERSIDVTECRHSPRGLFSLILFLLFAITVCAQQPKEYFTMDGPLVFNETEYKLAFSANQNDISIIQEYLPAGESFDDYSSMFTISLHRADVTPVQAVKSKMSELENRKKKDMICNYMVANRGAEYMLDFLVSDAPFGDFNTVEFDVHRYFNTTIDGEKYLVLLFYSERAYGDDITDYMVNLKEQRASIINKMASLSVPTFILKK